MKKCNDQAFIRESKNQLFLTFLSSLLIVGLGLMSCEGPEGPQGPAGPQGEQGPAGSQGEEGTANVIYSDWITPDSWEPAEFFGDSVRHGDLIAPDLTQEILDNGETKVYGDFVNVDAIYKLPVFPSMAGVNFTLNYKLKPDTVRLEFFYPENPDTDPGELDSSNEFRYVLIPGGQSASGSAKASGGELQDMSYEELKNRFDIPDEGSGVIRDVSLK